MSRRASVQAQRRFTALRRAAEPSPREKGNLPHERLCVPATHRWRFVEALVTGLAAPDGSYPMLTLCRCTQCPAVLELAGRWDGAQRRVKEGAAILWLSKTWYAIPLDCFPTN